MRVTLKWLLFSLAFVPLLVNYDTLFPFIFTKTLLIRGAVTLFWVFFAVWFFTRKDEAKKTLDVNWRFIKNPLYLLTSLYIFLMLLSTVFAVDWYRAFFGDIERGEGFLGMLHFFGFFVAALMVFKKSDWATFFKFNLITGAILLVDSIGEIVSGELNRAQSFVGNPTFTAGYFLFVILSALLAFKMTKDSIGWRIFSFAMIFGGMVGVFLTGTRGAILGLAAGIIVAILYFAVKGKSETLDLGFLKTDLQKASIILLVLAFLTVGGFAATRESALWQNIPGLNRFADITLQDNTVQTRLISAGVSLNAINPVDNGVHRFLLGYGWENFNVAYNKYFNPEYMRYEALWFDRAHNKLMDVLVMNGVLGLLAYLAAWLAVLYLAFRRIEDKQIAASLLFFGTAFFIQNLFVFDQISTYIPFFAFLGFTVFASSESGEFSLKGWFSKSKRLFDKIIPYKLPIVGVFLSFALVAYTLVPYFQSVAFIQTLKSGDVNFAMEKLETYTEPYNYAQSTIRNRLLTTAINLIGQPGASEFVDTSIRLHEEFLNREPYDPRDFNIIGSVYRLRGNNGEPGAHEKAEQYFLKALELSPTRQDHFYNLATLYADQGDFVKMQEYAGKMLEGSPTVPRTNILYVYLISREGPNRYAEGVELLNPAIRDYKLNFFSGEQDKAMLQHLYDLFIHHFYEIRDEEHFLTSLEGAGDLWIKLDQYNQILLSAGEIDVLPPEQYSKLQSIIDQFNSVGWDAVVIGR